MIGYCCLQILLTRKKLRGHWLVMEKTIPFIQELRNIETDEDVKNYMFDTMTEINKGVL